MTSGQGYRPEGWLPYWEVAVMLRKAGLVVVAAALADNRDGHQIYAGLAVLLAAAVAQIAFQPFEDTVQARLENASLTVSCCSLCESAQVAWLVVLPTRWFDACGERIRVASCSCSHSLRRMWLLVFAFSCLHCMRQMPACSTRWVAPVPACAASSPSSP